MLQLDLDQLKLVYEALHERDRLLANAAHLARPLPILTVSFALGAYLWRLEHHFRLHACAALGKQLACALHVLSVWQAQYQKLAMSTPSNLFTDPACNPPPLLNKIVLRVYSQIPLSLGVLAAVLQLVGGALLWSWPQGESMPSTLLGAWGGRYA